MGQSFLFVFSFSDLHGFEGALNSEEAEHQRQDNLDDDRGENDEDDCADLSTCQRRRHHNRDQVIVNDNDVAFIRVPLFEVHDEARQSCEENRERRNGDRRFGRKVEHGHDDGNGNAATSNTRNITQCHDKCEDKDSGNLEGLYREDLLMAAETIVCNSAEKEWVI